MSCQTKRRQLTKRQLCRGKPEYGTRPRTLKEVCEHYRRDYGDMVEQDAAWFGGCTGRAAIVRAASSLLVTGKLHPHQWRVGKRTLSSWVKALLSQEKEIRRASSFDELHRAVSKARIQGIGELTLYDTTHRLGLAHGLSPKQIYVHAGVCKGAKALGLSTSSMIEVRELHYPLNRLSAAAAEDLLCIYSEDLANIMRRLRADGSRPGCLPERKQSESRNRNSAL